MTNSRLTGNLLAIITAAAIAALLVGGAVGLAAFQLVYEPSHEDEFLGALGDVLFGAAAGALFGFVTYAAVAIISMSRLEAPQLTGLRKTGVVLLPVFALMVLFAAAQLSYFSISVVLVAIAAVVVLILPMAAKVRWQCLGVLTVVGIGFATINSLQNAEADREWQRQSAIESAQKLHDWNGPLVLINGDSTDIKQPNWNLLEVEAPYGNDSYDYVNLQWRRVNADTSEDNFVVAMHNTPLSDACAYDSCVEVGTSQLGPVYQSTSSNSYIVPVSNGHIEFQDYSLGTTQTLAIINSLQVVNADQFVAVAVNSAADGSH